MDRSLYFVSFITGLISSLHCVAMCGPLLMALSIKNANLWQKLIYHVGRVATYIVLGLIAGLFGNFLKGFFMQQTFSILLGISVLIFMVFRPFNKFVFLLDFSKKINRIQRSFTSMKTLKTLLAGVANGLLPCGMVYLAITGALSAGSLSEVSIFMLFYGFGTLPLLLFVQYLPQLFKNVGSFKFRKFQLIFTIVFSSLLILRGLNLGFSFFSPKLNSSNTTVICHTEK